MDRPDILTPWAFERHQDGDRVFLSAVAGDETLGRAELWLASDEAHVLDIQVSVAARRQAIGRSLLTSMLAEAQHHGYSAITLEVRASNQAAIALYESFGFVVEGRRAGYYADGEDALLMWIRELG